MPKMLICRICGNSEENKIYMVREMTFGTREEFKYFECSHCGCLQIKDIPPDMSKYYPDNYYSFSQPVIHISKNFIRKYFSDQRTFYTIYKSGFIGRLASMIRPPIPYLVQLQKCNANFDSKVLDVGCGQGQLLLTLAYYGFKNLIGLDQYIKNDIVYDNGVRVFKKEIYELGGNYDVIMFHHSFEHIPKPLEVFKAVYRLLNKKGHVLIRIPTVSSYAWRHYGINWSLIDAPRHLFLHSLKSMELLAFSSNLKIDEIIFDSNEVQFWASEQLIRDIPIYDEKSYQINPKKSIFSKEEIRLFRLRAAELNEKKMGDQVCIYLTKDGDSNLSANSRKDI